MANADYRRRKGKKNKDSDSAFDTRIIAAVIVMAVAVVLFIAAMHFLSLFIQNKEMKDALDTPVIYNNVFIDGTNVGGLTRQQAKAELERTALDNLVTRNITISDGSGQDYRYTYKDFDAGYDFDASVEEAYSYARSGSINERYAMLLALDDQPHYIVSKYGFSEEKIYDIVKSLESEVYVAPIVPNEDNPIGRVGKKLNVEATCKALKDLLTFKSDGDRDAAVFMAIETINPQSAN